LGTGAKNGGLETDPSDAADASDRFRGAAELRAPRISAEDAVEVGLGTEVEEEPELEIGRF
jgi:hypothetical protein